MTSNLLIDRLYQSIQDYENQINRKENIFRQ
jgi:hypothetical protein